MRILRLLGGVLVVLAAGSLVFGQADIADTPHNLSTTGTNQITDKSTNEDQICVFCHTPHEAAPDVPLWNHTQSGQGSYGVYDSTTMDATAVDIGGGTDISNLCMSCHDGTIGVNDLGNPANDTGGDPAMGDGNELDTQGRITTAANMGTSLTNDHPINFTYTDSTATDLEILAPDDATDWVETNVVPLFGGKVQCATCHDPHDNTAQPFLVKANTNSDLCLTCHDK
jgi:predicted CXXCH cytochrome family protein